jgi:hypothetical protein
MHAQQKWLHGNLRDGADSGLFTTARGAFKTTGRYLLFHPQLLVTNQRAKMGNQGRARFINSANVVNVHAPATY